MKKNQRELTHKEVCARGGTNRWKGTTKEQRSEEMRRVALVRHSGKK